MLLNGSRDLVLAPFEILSSDQFLVLQGVDAGLFLLLNLYALNHGDEMLFDDVPGAGLRAQRFENSGADIMRKLDIVHVHDLAAVVIGEEQASGALPVQNELDSRDFFLGFVLVIMKIPLTRLQAANVGDAGSIQLGMRQVRGLLDF